MASSLNGICRGAIDYRIVAFRETPQGNLKSPLIAGASYTKLMGVEHNVVNDNSHEFVFVEIELK